MFEKDAEYYAKEKYSPNTDPFIIAVADDAFKDGAEFGYNKANEWQYPSRGELPECDETKKLWLYFKDYYANDRDCEHPFYRTSTGVYKTSFLNENVKVFAEKTKGYESEILLKDVIAWKEIVLPELPKESE